MSLSLQKPNQEDLCNARFACAEGKLRSSFWFLVLYKDDIQCVTALYNPIQKAIKLECGAATDASVMSRMFSVWHVYAQGLEEWLQSILCCVAGKVNVRGCDTKIGCRSYYV